MIGELIEEYGYTSHIQSRGKEVTEKRNIRINKQMRRKDISLSEQTLAVLPVFEFFVKKFPKNPVSQYKELSSPSGGNLILGSNRCNW